MLLSTDATSQKNAARTNNNTSRGLLAIVELHHRAKNLHAQEPNSLIPRTILRDLISALHYRDENTFSHSQRVAQLAVGLSRQLYWNDETQNLLEVAALLHDIGKIGIPDHILYKPGPFTGEESSLMALGTEVANDILQICDVNPELRQAILESRMPFSFFNDQTRSLGKEISLAGRLLAVVDVYESLSRAQVYRNALTHEEIITYLKEQAGLQFDPNIVTAIDRWLKPAVLKKIRASLDQNSNSFPQSDLEGSLATTSLCNVFSDLYSLESQFDGVLIVDEKQKIIVKSQGIQSLYGHKDQAESANNWSPEKFPLADPYQKPFPRGSYPLEQALKSNRSSSLTVKLPGETGSGVDVELQSLPLIDFSGQHQGVAEFYKYKERAHQQTTQYRELALQASLDALTGIANRGELENQLSSIMEKYENDPQEHVFSVVYLDIDHFKNINDNYGHAVGDEVLVKLADLLQRETYSSEFVARYGGEEFVVICPGLQLKQAVGRAERLRLEIAKLTFESGSDLAITSSFGVAESEPGDSLDQLLKRSDQALYQSKRDGRNRTSFLEKKDQVETAAKKKVSKKKENGFVFVDEMHCMLYENILVMKLKGYVQEHHAKLIHIKAGKVIIQIGRRGFFSGWGKKENSQPVRIEIDATDALIPSHSKRKKQKVGIRITPIGSPKNRDMFQNRARHAFRDLKAHFVSE